MAVFSRQPETTPFRIMSAGLVAVLLLFSTVSTTMGYVLPGPYLVDMLARSMGSARTLVVDQRQILFGLSENGQEQAVTETLHYRFPFSLRSDITTAVARRIFIQEGNRQTTVLDGKVVAGADNRLDLYRSLLLARNRMHLQRLLVSSGIDIGVSSLGHDGPEVVYILGAAFPDTTPAQLWISKDRFLPVRWILYPPATASAGTQQIEFRFQKWEKLGDGLWYPMRMECYQNQILVREITVVKVRVNEPFDVTLFNMDRFEQAPPGPTKTPATRKSAPEMEEVQKTIEDFKKIYQ